MVAVLLVTTSVTPIAPHGTANEPPTVDAGLDQQVTNGTTVLLDATGSSDPDGTIVEYTWTIHTPSGDVTDPACPTCARTRFRATERGTYNVSVSATDDDGATSTDYLYVTVTPDEPPTVNLTGPKRLPAETPATFEANVTPGSEPVDDVTWRIDETTLPVDNTTTVTKRFDDTGTRTLTVTVTDAIGRTATDTLPVTIETTNATPPPGDGNGTSPTDPPNGTAPTDPPNGSDPGPIVVTPTPGPGNGSTQPGDSNPGDGQSNESDGAGTLASQFDPTVTGAQLVTGDHPLNASYAISVDATPENVSSIQWTVNGNGGPTSPGVDVTWTAGRHAITAKVTYTDGSTDTATFADGSTDVVADPAPDPTLDDPTVETTVVNGDFTVEDGYGNLADVTITVDDDTVFDLDYPPMRRFQPTHVRDHYRHETLDPNETYTVTLTATDDRGQTRTTTKTIETKTGPEIISIGFTNDPVDSYHPRIDEDRYTATHVVKIDLNGYDPEEVRIMTKHKKPDTKTLNFHRRSYNHQQDVLTVVTKWAGEDPGKYPVLTTLYVNGQSSGSNLSQFVVESSPPELRLTSPTEGTKTFVQEWGMVIDARKSFDPDGHTIDIEWIDGANSINGHDWIAELTPTDTAGVRISDETGATVEELGSFLPYYIPGIIEQREMTEGPYNRSEEVTFEIWTDSYAFTKNTKRYNITLGARTNSSEVDIVSIEKRDVPIEEVDGHNAIKHRLHRWVATVRVEAEALNESENWVTLYNVENPERIYVSQELGEVQLAFSEKARNLSLTRTAYRVKNKSGGERVGVTDRQRYRRLLRDGWSFEKRVAVVDSISIEKHETETYTETKMREFGDRTGAKQFAASQTKWSYAGKETTEETETVVVSEWRRKVTAGRPTGQTRQVVSNPNAYETEYQYQYSTTTTKTVTKDVTKEVPVTVTVEKTVEREVCRRYVGCYTRKRTITVEKTKMVERTVTVEREVTHRIQHRYWATSPYSDSHTPTGSSRRVRSEPKRYHTEYLVQIPETRTQTVSHYVVSKSVQKTRKEWNHFTNVSTLVDARRIASSENKRIGSLQKDSKWILTKDMNATEVVRSYDKKENVMVTYGTVSGTLVYGPDPDQKRDFTITIEMTEYATKEELIEEARTRITDCESEGGDCDE